MVDMLLYAVLHFQKLLFAQTAALKNGLLRPAAVIFQYFDNPVSGPVVNDIETDKKKQFKSPS